MLDVASHSHSDIMLALGGNSFTLAPHPSRLSRITVLTRSTCGGSGEEVGMFFFFFLTRQHPHTFSPQGGCLQHSSPSTSPTLHQPALTQLWADLRNALALLKCVCVKGVLGGVGGGPGALGGGAHNEFKLRQNKWALSVQPSVRVSVHPYLTVGCAGGSVGGRA